MCLNSWSAEGFVKSTDIQMIAALEEIKGDDDIELAQGWDMINVDWLHSVLHTILYLRDTWICLQ